MRKHTCTNTYAFDTHAHAGMCVRTYTHAHTSPLTVVRSSDHSKNNSIVSEQDAFAKIHTWVQLNDIHANLFLLLFIVIQQRIQWTISS